MAKTQEKVITEYVCQYCGKKFTAEGKFRRKWCSEECKKAARTRYNTKYITERRATDKEFADKTRKVANRVSSRLYVQNKWNERLNHAEVILKLAQMANAKNLIAEYLDINFVNRGAGCKMRLRANEEEVQAATVLESIGDEFLTSK